MESQTRLTRISGSRFLTFCQKAPRPPFGKPDEDKAWPGLKGVVFIESRSKTPPRDSCRQDPLGGLQGEGTGENRREPIFTAGV